LPSRYTDSPFRERFLVDQQNYSAAAPATSSATPAIGSLSVRAISGAAPGGSDGPVVFEDPAEYQQDSATGPASSARTSSSARTRAAAGATSTATRTAKAQTCRGHQFNRE
jgi:hypothetical protein